MKKMGMRSKIMILAAMLCLYACTVHAKTVAYWRFEEGVADQAVPHSSGGTWEENIVDSSGNGNYLSVWDDGSNGHVYRANIGASTIPLTGKTNTLSLENSGGGPGMWTSSTSMQTMTPAEWTIEVAFKLENGGYRTLVGRDSEGSVTDDDDLAALYFQVISNDAIAIKFCDVTGQWHSAVSATGMVECFDYGTDPDGAGVPWYSTVAVSDGTLLSLYLKNITEGGNYKLIAQTDMTGSSTNTALTAGEGDGGDWDAGNWTVCRGLYDGGHVDRAYGYVDEIRISDTALPIYKFLFSPDRAVTCLNPTNGQTGVSLNPTLKWASVLDANDLSVLTYNVYFAAGTDPNLLTTPVLASTSNTSYTPGSLDYATAYMWRVDTYEPNAVAGGASTYYEGNVWTFTTRDQVPVITNQPTNQAGAVGETVQFTVAADSASELSYAWYSLDGTTVLSTTDTLSVTIVDENDENGFYCVVSNDAGDTPSSVAYLTVKRLIAYWTFDGDLSETVNGWEGTSRPSTEAAVYDAGISGQALGFDGDPDTHCVVIGGSNESFPEFMQRGGFTFSCWVNTTQDGWGGLITMTTRSSSSGNYKTWSGVGLAMAYGYIEYQIKGDIDGGGESGLEAGDGELNDGKWHHIVGAFDGLNKKYYLYVDGKLADKLSKAAPVDVNQELMFGNEMTLVPGSDTVDSGLVPLEGLIDDARVYNYALSATEVGNLYAAFAGSFCVSQPQFDISGPEGVSDCVVDIYDFAALASTWLECNVFPTCVDAL